MPTWVNVVIMALNVSGGLGFLTWADLHQTGSHSPMAIPDKVILSMTASSFPPSSFRRHDSFCGRARLFFAVAARRV